jgi:gas vesicle structural protein
MANGMQSRSSGTVDRPRASSLADVIEVILDKGLVIDAYVRVSLVGIEVLTIDARIVIAGVDTYLRFAEATNRLDLTRQGGKDLPELMQSMTEGGAKGKTSGALSGSRTRSPGRMTTTTRAAVGGASRRSRRRPAARHDDRAGAVRDLALSLWDRVR